MEIKSTPTSEIDRIYQTQSQFFNSGETYSHSFRRQQLRKLKEVISQYEKDVISALKSDFSKPEFETYVSEIGFVYEELEVKLKNLKQWMKPKKVSSPITSWPSKSYIRYEPKGVTLVIGPWNYPFQLLVAPVIASLAAGNTVVIKPSEKTPAVARLVEKMITENFEEGLLAVVQGEGKEVIPQLISEHRFDHVFFTGSVPVGRKIAEMAAPQLTPVTLELGGKSPAIIGKSAKLKVAARRMAFAKFINGGQTCVAPDYLLIDEQVKDEFLKILTQTLDEFYKENALENDDFASIVNQDHYQRIKKYLGQGTLVYGGQADDQKLRIEPSILIDVNLEDEIMKDEIFGPVLPVISFASDEEALQIIRKNPYPLALYVFSEDSEQQKRFTRQVQFGGGMINNALLHLSNPNLPFGGIGTSGFGNYHGKSGFLTFSHQKALMKTATWFDLKQKYPPYGRFAYKMIKKVMGEFP